MKKKIIVVLTAALCITAVLSCCGGGSGGSGGGSGGSGGGNDSRVGTVTISSGGQTITPEGFRVYEVDRSGNITDDPAPEPWEIAGDLPVITYAADFKADISNKSQVYPFEFRTYNERFTSQFRGTDPGTLGPGTHTVILDIGWGNNEAYVAYWYYFNLVIE